MLCFLSVLCLWLQEFKWRWLHYILRQLEEKHKHVCVGCNPPAFLLIVLSECTLIINSNYVLAARFLFCCYVSYSITHVSCGVYSGVHSSVRDYGGGPLAPVSRVTLKCIITCILQHRHRTGCINKEALAT